MVEPICILVLLVLLYFWPTFAPTLVLGLEVEGISQLMF